MTDAKNGIEMVKSEFISEMVNDQVYWLPKTKSFVKGKSPTAYLLPNYDEYFIGFKDRSAINEVAHRAGSKGDTPPFLANVIILDGQIIGSWKRTVNKDSVIMEASLITKLKKAEEQAIREAAEHFGKFIGLPIKFNLQESNHEQRKTRSV
jgi:hypothetical protein